MDLLDDADPAVDECSRAWQESALRDAVDGANSYYATSIPAPSWATDDKFTIQIGKTRFFKL
jgi:spore germination cell wall hydrolase CwlJ-like protein